jgi:predicted kinase
MMIHRQREPGREDDSTALLCGQPTLSAIVCLKGLPWSPGLYSWGRALTAQEDDEEPLLMKSKPIVYVLCGFIGAGKTTLAKKLEERTGAVRITKDEWLIQIIGNDPTIDGYADYDGRMCELSRDVAFQLAAKGIDVIIDERVWLKEQRDILRRRAEEAGAQAVVYFLDTPNETIRERVARRNMNLANDAFKISGDLLEYYLQYWQPPGEDEEYVLASEVR